MNAASHFDPQTPEEITRPARPIRFAQPRPRLARLPIELALISAFLAVMVIGCAVCSFSLVLIGPERVLALRDQLLGDTPQKRQEAIAQVVQMVVRGDESVWPAPNRGRLTVLLMGVDRRPQEGEAPTRSDAITLVAVDPISRTAAMLSIPRDLYVPLAQIGLVDRINTAYVYGEVRNLPGGGAQLARDTLTLNLGVPIQKHFIINFEGFKKAIDALGGIDIDVPNVIVDEAYPTDDYRTERLVIPAGRIHMDGELALKYVRTRHQDSDFGRLQRQQQMILAVRDKALSLDMLAQLPQLIDAAHGFYQTDLSLAEMVSLARVWSEIPRERIAVYRIDESMVQYWTTPGGGSVLIPLREVIAPIVDAFLYGPLDASAVAP